QVGIMGSYDKGDSGLTSGDGTVKATAGALYGTWKNDKGHHVDLLAKVGKIKSESTSYGGTIPQALSGDFSSTAVGVSAEYGYRKELKNDVFIEPMVRASYVKLGSDDYTVTTNDGNMDVTNDGFNTFQLRGGVLIGKNLSNDSNVYAKLAVLHNFSGSVDTHISADGRTNSFSDDLSGTGFEYGIGTNYKFNKDSSLYADIERISGGSITKNWGLNVGYKYTF
ncbi:MAG: autotransporter outer membrane beta-barrel domain-containing protein, partial [Acidaminococcaceae bacterium]|nr:autotransporter outer membrane beta-barrel domain-containing protein [Acidaminococcaceae bacterium]